MVRPLVVTVICSLSLLAIPACPSDLLCPRRRDLISTADGDTLTLSLGDEEEGRRLLSDFLDTIAVPLSDEAAKWEP